MNFLLSMTLQMIFNYFAFEWTFLSNLTEKREHVIKILFEFDGIEWNVQFTIDGPHLKRWANKTNVQDLALRSASIYKCHARSYRNKILMQFWLHTDRSIAHLYCVKRYFTVRYFCACHLYISHFFCRLFYKLFGFPLDSDNWEKQEKAILMLVTYLCSKTRKLP